VNAVTGAFSYTGSHIARRLLDDGEQVRTLSRAPSPDHPLAGRVEYKRLQFESAIELVDALRGIDTLYNTYWVRFARGATTWDSVVENTSMLMRAAGAAGVSRVVHVSVTNPDVGSDLLYYRNKAFTEEIVRRSPVSYAIVRPTLIFGSEDILLNNIAWILRRFPFFVSAGDGSYRVQPVSVRDVASICVAAAKRSDDIEVDAAGPDVYTYDELVTTIAAAIDRRARIRHASRATTATLAKVLGALKRDTLLSGQELDGLMEEKLTSADPPRGTTHFGSWLAGYGSTLGRSYASERRRNWA
jgi:NADH dehydrogenase